MKRASHIPPLWLAPLCLPLLLTGLTACGGSGGKTASSASLAVTQDDISGVWSDSAQNYLLLDPANGRYLYRTCYGRLGSGDLELTEGRYMLSYDDFLYDFQLQDGGFVLDQNGSSDRESLDGMAFTRAEQEELMWDRLLQADAGQLDAISGTWQNSLHETLVIDTGRMEYLAYDCDAGSMGSGTLADAHDGRGPYLFLNGRAYPRFSLGGGTLMLYFYPSQTQQPDGTFSGVFYQMGDAQEIALYHLDQAQFTTLEGHLVYHDGLNLFYLPESYALGEDGLAYDQDGHRFAAGFDFTPFDPAEIWGPDWAEQWG